MSFWQKQDGSAVENTTSFEMGGGDIKPIPNNTALIAAIEEAKWAEYDGEHYINLKWRVKIGRASCRERVSSPV